MIALESRQHSSWLLKIYSRRMSPWWKWGGLLQQFSAQRRRPRGDLPALVHALGLEQVVLNQSWSELSVSSHPHLHEHHRHPLSIQKTQLHLLLHSPKYRLSHVYMTVLYLQQHEAGAEARTATELGKFYDNFAKLRVNGAWFQSLMACTLQGGQAQRVTLAICIALKPDFLLLDGEPPEFCELSHNAIKNSICGQATLTSVADRIQGNLDTNLHWIFVKAGQTRCEVHDVLLVFLSQS